jgi:hypothetical protein
MPKTIADELNDVLKKYDNMFTHISDYSKLCKNLIIDILEGKNKNANLNEMLLTFADMILNSDINLMPNNSKNEIQKFLKYYENK